MNLFAKLFLSVTTLITLIMLGVVYSVLTREQELIVGEMREKGHSIAKLMAVSSVNLLLKNDYSTMKRYTEAIIMDKDIKYVIIMDPTGLVKMHTNLDLIGEFLSDDLAVNSLIRQDGIQKYRMGAGEDVYDITEPIIASDKSDLKLGIVRIGISTRKMYSEIAKSRNRILFMGLIAILVGMLGSLIMGRTISRPIKKLVRSAQAISQGNLEVSLKVTSKDEVGLLTEAFRDMAEALKRNIQEMVKSEKLVTVGKMAAGLAHEVKNPLEAIKGSAEYLGKKYADDKTIGKFTAIIKEEIDEVVEFLDEYLQYAKPSKPSFSLKDVNVILEETLYLLDKLVARKQIGVNRRMDPDLPLVLADSLQMKQVFLNIILNAIESMSSGGTLSIQTFRQKPEDRSDQVVIAISDTGKGIPPEYLGRIFDPFYTSKEKGSGLGLSISQGIIESHRGRISVESEPGKGSVFRIALPV
ncbi:MAG: ATP-binding protein [Thermodesulfobacteriota bacterium]